MRLLKLIVALALLFLATTPRTLAVASTEKISFPGASVCKEPIDNVFPPVEVFDDEDDDYDFKSRPQSIAAGASGPVCIPKWPTPEDVVKNHVRLPQMTPQTEVMWKAEVAGLSLSFGFYYIDPDKFGNSALSS